MLFSDTFDVYAEFARSQRCRTARSVRVAGMDAGEVDEIQVPSGPGAKFRVRLRVREDLHPAHPRRFGRDDSERRPRRQQVRADRGGHRAVADRAGSGHDPEPRAVRLRGPDAEDERHDRHRQHDDRVLKGEVDDALGSITETAATARALIDDVGVDARAIMASSQKVSADLQAIVAGVKQGRGTVGQLVTDDACSRTRRKSRRTHNRRWPMCGPRRSGQGCDRRVTR